MNDTPNNETEKKARQMEWIKNLWLILIPVFSIILVFKLYSWSRGKDDITGIFSPLTFIFVGLANIFSTRNRTLYYIFLAAGVICAVAILTSLILY